jgi:hypothetical protein
MGLDLWGFASVGVMATAYALESRGRTWVLVFAAASMSASAYAVAIESWPFALVEGVWSVISLRRWWATPANEVQTGS